MAFPEDALTWIVPILVSTIIPFILLAMGKFSITRDQTITGTIKMENVQGDVTELRDTLKEGFINQNKLLYKRMDEINVKFDKMDGRLQDLEREWYNLKYRVEQVENKIRSGGERSAV